MSDGAPPQFPKPVTGTGWEPPTAPPLMVPGSNAAAGSNAALGSNVAPGSETAVGPNMASGSDGPGRVRPWWGMGDALLMLPIMALVLAISVGMLVVGAVIDGVSPADIGDVAADLPAWLVVVPTMVQQLAWFGWPFIVSKWKGLGPASDWGWAFKPVDIGIGIGVAFMATFAAGLVAAGASAVLDLENEDLAENTQILNDMEGSPWLYGLLFVVVIGAPFSEEVLFRGLIQRSVEKRWGVVAGVIGSLLIFVPIHIADGGPFNSGQIVLWLSIATLGAALGITAAVTRRLAAPIVAHVLINGLASASALGYFDRLVDSVQT